MPPKRPHEAAQNGGDDAKRPRTSNEGVALSASPANSIQAQIEAAKARAAALMKGIRPNGDASASPAAPASAATVVRPTPPPVRGAENAAGASKSGGFDVAAVQRQIAEARRKADEMTKAHLSKTQQRNDGPAPSGLHPLLAGNGAGSSSAASSSYASRHVAPKFSTLSANARLVASQGRSAAMAAMAEPSANPYLQAAADEEGDDTPRARQRTMHKGLTFNAPGRHIRKAEEARHEAQMEALKRRIEESARKAGMSELTAEERALRRPQPPEVEWWDQAFLPGNSYEPVALLDKGKGKEIDLKGQILIEGEGSPIDIYIQHPIPIPAPSDKIKVQPRGVMLTKKEQKKMRKMRRQAEREDKQDQIKMGLLPPDPPKVKLSNLMRVLASESVADPTKVEARVRREVAARKDQHEQTNYERMLTPEQRREKAETAKQEDLSKGIYTLVFKVRHLVSPSHKFKVRKNALQYGLTGMTVFGPNYALVVVEGGQKAIKAYRRLMTVRIDWSDPKRPKHDVDDDDLGFGTPGPSEGGGGRFGSVGPGSLSNANVNAAEQEQIAQIDWTQNYCHLIFEGPLRERNFGYGFKARTCETDGDAKEMLGPKLASFWDLAKREERAEEDDGGL